MLFKLFIFPQNKRKVSQNQISVCLVAAFGQTESTPRVKSRGPWGDARAQKQRRTCALQNRPREGKFDWPTPTQPICTLKMLSRAPRFVCAPSFDYHFVIRPFAIDKSQRIVDVMRAPHLTQKLCHSGEIEPGSKRKTSIGIGLIMSAWFREPSRNGSILDFEVGSSPIELILGLQAIFGMVSFFIYFFFVTHFLVKENLWWNLI